MFLMHRAHITYVSMYLDRSEAFRVASVYAADGKAKRRFRRSAVVRMSEAAGCTRRRESDVPLAVEIEYRSSPSIHPPPKLHYTPHGLADGSYAILVPPIQEPSS